MAAPAWADEPARALDEAAFIAAVEQAHPRIAQLGATVEAARAEVGVVGIRPNPSVAIDREQVFPDGGGGATNYARLTLPIELSGRRGRRVAAARTAADAVAADADAQRFALLVEARRVYTEAAHRRLRLATLRTERENLVRLVEVVRRRAGAGAASGYDLQRFELELAAYDDLIVSAELELDELSPQLALLAGMPGERVEATGDLALPAVGGLPDDDRILAGRADHRAAELRARSAAERAAAASRARIPDVALSGGLMSADAGGETALGFTVGLSFTLPLLERGNAEAARAHADRRVAEAEARTIEAGLPATVRARHAAFARRVTQAESFAARQLARLDGLLRSAETGYREGDGSVVELLDAYEAARDARLRALELRRDARLAELDLWTALGGRP